MRSLASPVTSRSLGALVFIDKNYPGSSITYSLVITSTTIGITNGINPFTITYIGKSTKQISLELSNSPYPITILIASDIPNLQAGELTASGTQIPEGFDQEDRALDGRSALVRCTRYSILYNKLSSISLSAPYFNSSTSAWWARINNGSFSQVYKGITYFFSIPEYNTQTWSPTLGKPFADADGEVAVFTDKNTIQLSRYPVVFKSNNISFSSAGFDKTYSARSIKDVDTINGIVYLNSDANLAKDVIVNYTYLENSYTYKHVNLNAHFNHNPFLMDKYVLFYLRPSSSSDGAHRTRTVFHTVGTSLQDAIYSIPGEESIEPISIIGAINVKPYSSATDIAITDTRTYGGGLHDNEFGRSIENSIKESQCFFDIGHKNGIPYPGAASFVVELPSDLKEVLSISDIKARAEKYIAAGVYPIYKFQEEEYYSQFQANNYNTDISMADYSIQLMQVLSGYEDIFSGSDTSAEWWIKDYDLPNNLYSGYSGDYTTTNAKLLNGYISIPSGNCYTQSYLRSSPQPVFSYEERELGGQWERKTIRDTNIVDNGRLSLGVLEIGNNYGYSEIRNITGFAPYYIDGSFWSDLPIAASSVLQLDNSLCAITQLKVPTGQIPDVRYLQSTAVTDYFLSINDVQAVKCKYYNEIYDKNFYTGDRVLETQIRAAYLGMTGSSFPRLFNVNTSSYVGHYTGSYDALRDVYLYATYAKGRINHYISNYVGQPIDLTGAVWLQNSNNANIISFAYSGAYNIATKILSLNPYTGGFGIETDYITPYYNPATNTRIPMYFPSGRYGEIDSLISNIEHHTDYLKAFSSLYAMQLAPTTGQYNTTMGLKYAGNWRDLCLTGIGIANQYFDSYFTAVGVSGTCPNTWLTKYNRIGTYAARYFDNVCTAIDNLYYGNIGWAGYTGYEAKSSPYFSVVHNNIPDLSGDLTWGNTISLADGSIVSASQAISNSAEHLYTNLLKVEPYIQAGAKRGGIFQPGSIKAIRHYLWLPTHIAKEDPLFTNLSIDTTRLVDTFEVGMSTMLKGSVNQDGILIEGGSFHNKPAPFSGTVPSELMVACADAIRYYRLTVNIAQEKKWEAIAHGILRSSIELYHYSGGYPFNPLDPATSTLHGDSGSVPLNGYLALMAQYTGVYSSSEFTTITGNIPAIT